MERIKNHSTWTLGLSFIGLAKERRTSEVRILALYSDTMKQTIISPKDQTHGFPRLH